MNPDKDEFHRLAREQLLDEDRELREAGARTRLARRGSAQRAGAENFPSDKLELLATLQQKKMLLRHLATKRFRSAEDDHQIDRLRSQIYDLRARCRQAGIVPPRMR
jgi:hypothetical protein